MLLQPLGALFQAAKGIEVKAAAALDLADEAGWIASREQPTESEALFFNDFGNCGDPADFGILQ